MKAHEGLLDGIEGIAQNAKELESIIDTYAIDVDGVGTHGASMSNDDAVKVFEGLIDMRRRLDRMIEYWCLLD